MLLAHRSGIGDYLDEAAHRDVNDPVLSVPVHTLADTQSFLPILEGFLAAFNRQLSGTKVSGWRVAGRPASAAACAMAAIRSGVRPPLWR